jgi:hypothetical protein
MALTTPNLNREPDTGGVEERSMRQRPKKKLKYLPRIAVAAASPAKGKPIKASNTMIALCDATEPLGEGGTSKNKGISKFQSPYSCRKLHCKSPSHENLNSALYKRKIAKQPSCV